MKKKIELNKKLFLKKGVVAELNISQSSKVLGGWVTRVAETRVDPIFTPGCMSCAPTFPPNCP